MCIKEQRYKQVRENAGHNRPPAKVLKGEPLGAECNSAAKLQKAHGPHKNLSVSAMSLRYPGFYRYTPGF